MASVLDKELIKYFVKLNEVQKKSLLEMMKSFLIPDNDTTVDSTTLEEYNHELDEAMARINNGECTSLDELEKEMRAW